ncbi:hypothetical protein RRG08_066459 [Elysia crispata]|uniref:Uncharacterized protein n=1 Tax=Elysia crispata TaxID=231223 RepID=A0AAE1E892_9GAST|nr:hypothetical protein RRG08_066459 [Elysia crispata]
MCRPGRVIEPLRSELSPGLCHSHDTNVKCSRYRSQVCSPTQPGPSAAGMRDSKTSNSTVSRYQHSNSTV